MKLLTQSVIFLLFAAILVTISSCTSKDKGAKTLQNSSPPVPVTVASAGVKASNGIQASGRLEATETANISTRVMGYIIKLNVKVGDKVQAGQVLATINDQEMSAKRAQADAMIAEASASLESAQKDYNRFTALYGQQSASAKELDNVTLQYNSAKARVEAAKQMRNEVSAMMRYTTLTAPFSGTVIQRSAEPGTLASPGMPVLTIEKNAGYHIKAAIPETEISKIRLKDKVQIDIKSAGRMFEGFITEINPSSQLSGGQYMVKISVPEKENKGLYSGMYVNALIESTQNTQDATDNERILVPLSAIIHKDQLEGLYTISNTGTALLRWVRLGKTSGENVEVLSGLNPSEQFILKADGKLYNGVPVIVKETK